MFPVANPHLWFLILVAPACFATALSDLRSMKIRNLTVLYIVAVFLVFGPFILPIGEFGWRLLNGVIALVITFTLNQINRMGGGDAKFIAAMVPYVAPVMADLSFALFLMSSGFLAAFTVQRTFRRFAPIRNLAPHWESWTHKGFPMGLALGFTLFFYLLATAVLRHYGLA